MDKRDKLEGEKPVNEGLLGETQPSKMGQTHLSSSRIWMALAIVFMIISVALAVFIIYSEVSDSKDSSKTTISNKSEESVVSKFPNFFRTPEEQRVYSIQYEEQTLKNITRVPVEPSKNSTEECSFSCRQRPSRKKRSFAPRSLMQWITSYKAVNRMKRDNSDSGFGDAIYHACCISRHKFSILSTAKDKYNRDVTIIQFQNRNQYFNNWQCNQAQDCNGCTCMQEMNYVTAVVENLAYPDNSDEEVVVEFVLVSGCCKCYNIG